MKCRIVEIKARCSDVSRIREILKSRRADFRGTDHQIDTYFRVPRGRLKLREGQIENALIFYQRSNQKKSKRCDAFLYQCPEPDLMKKILNVAFGVLAVVDKMREIYFIKNVKFHVDQVKGLGRFVEIEAQGRTPECRITELRRQCDHYRKLLGIAPEDLLADSYSDQLICKRQNRGTTCLRGRRGR